MSYSQEAKNAEVLMSVSSRLIVGREIPYLFFHFDVPPEIGKLSLRLNYTVDSPSQVPIVLYDPTGIRGILVQPYQQGTIIDELWVATDDAGKGGIFGDIRAGQWTAQIFVRRLRHDTDFKLTAYGEFDSTRQIKEIRYPKQMVINSDAGWYKGELHAHSNHSTGETPFSDLVSEAIRYKYDFLSVTDHMTISHWSELVSYEGQKKIILMQAAEIAGNYGHANIHGISTWVDPFVDRPDWGMNQVSDEVHKQNGLVCINHPMSGKIGWRYNEFQLDKADLYEIYCTPEGPNNASALTMWDHHLLSGKRLVAVGSTDSHNPYSEPLWNFGQLVNWVYADSLSTQGIIEGLRRGIVYISRGPEIRFTAHNKQNDSREMWQSFASGEDITFQIKIKNAPKSNLFIIKNGYPFDIHQIDEIKDEWHTLTFQDSMESPAYYRIEIHSYKKDLIYTGIDYRDHETMLVLTNPIWIATGGSS